MLKQLLPKELPAIAVIPLTDLKNWLEGLQLYRPVFGMDTISKIIKPILLMAILICGQLPASAQHAGTIITGSVSSDADSIVRSATIRLKEGGNGCSTDGLGNYRLTTLLKGKRWIYCYSVGFQRDSLLVSLSADSIKVDFKLKQALANLNEVTVRVRKRLPERIPAYTLNDFDVVTTPGAVGDVAAALQTFPGASPAGNETGLFVHSGAAYETQAFFDGMLIKNAFGSRLPDIANRSRFSAFLFDKTDFSTSGYSASYGQALSSAFTMETKGLAAKTSTEFSALSLGTGAAHIERFENSSLMIGCNYYNFGLNNRVNPSNVAWQLDPEQYQGSMAYKLKTGDNGMLKVFADYSDTKLAFDIINPRSIGSDLLSDRNKNLYLNANYQGMIAPQWKIYAGTAYNGTLEIGSVNADNYHQYDKMLQEKVSMTREFYDNSAVTAGVESFQNNYQQGYAVLESRYNDILTAGFAESEIYLGKPFILKAGIRAEHSGYLDRSNLSPRTSLLVKANAKSMFTLNYGTYYARPEDSFTARSAKVNFEKSTSYSVGYDLALLYRFLHLEAYTKAYDHLLKFTTPVFSGFQSYGPPISISDINNSGNGYARGIDVLWRDQRTIVGGEYYVSYSFADSKRNYIDFPVSARPAFAPQHTVNVVGRKLYADYRTQISGTYTYSSGRSYFNPQNPVFMGNRTKDFHNLSLGISYLPYMGKAFAIINLTCANILGLNQVYGYRYSYDGSRRETIRPPAGRSLLLSFLVNFEGGTFNH